MHDVVDWKEVDERLRRLADEKGKYDLEEGTWLVAGVRARVHVRLGFRTPAEMFRALLR